MTDRNRNLRFLRSAGGAEQIGTSYVEAPAYFYAKNSGVARRHS